jgi:hypothetical protein
MVAAPFELKEEGEDMFPMKPILIGPVVSGLAAQTPVVISRKIKIIPTYRHIFFIMLPPLVLIFFLKRTVLKYDSHKLT